jgi:hypothetical protein
VVGQARQLSTRGQRASPNSVDPWVWLLASIAYPYKMPDRTSHGQYLWLATILFNNASRVLVLSQSDGLRMPQPVDLRFMLHLSIDWTACRLSGVSPKPANEKAQDIDSREGLIGSVGMSNVLSEQMRPT